MKKLLALTLMTAPLWCDPVFLHLKGIAVVDKPHQEQLEKGISFHGVTPPALEDLKAKLETKFLQHGILSDKLREVEQVVKAHFQSHGIEWVVVMIPEQEIAQGVLQIVVVQGILGTVECRGNRWFSDALLKSYISGKKGEVLNNDGLLNDVAWMNRNPFRNTNIALKSAQDPMEVDLQLITRDSFPLRVYVGADNTGTSATGRAREFAGITWGNVFGLDHRFTYQYTTDSHFHRFQAHTFQYLAPLPWRHQLFMYGGLSWIHPDIRPFDSKGNSGQFSLRYTIPWNPLYTGLLNELTWGFDFKRMNNDLFFTGNEIDVDLIVPLTTHEVNLTQAVLGYSFAKQYPHHRAKFDIEIFMSPASWLPDQSHRDYNELRTGAKPQYAYTKLAFGNIWSLPRKFGMSFLSRAQLATTNLLPSEQFGLGGYDTVRGYQERQVNVDNVLCLNLEFHSPKWPIFGTFSSVKDEFMLLLFADYGLGRNCNLLPGEELNQYLIGIGPGLRYSIAPYFSARVDYGFPLHKTQFQQQMKPQLHVGVTAAY